MTAEVDRAGVGVGEARVAEREPARRRTAWIPYAFVAPLLAIFAAFYLWPALNTVLGSFFRWGLLNPWTLTSPDEWNFVGLENYAQTLSSGAFWNAVVNTAIWLVLFPLLVTVVSLLASVGIWYTPAGGRIFRSIFLLPMTISLAAAGVIWTFVYNPDFGVLPAFMSALNLDVALDLGPIQLQPNSWLSNPGVIDLGLFQIRLINVALVVAGFWAFTGFGVITITAGLTSVPEEMVEAARVDGARAHQLIRYILIPALKGPLAIVVTISLIFALRTFDIVWVITQGGPARDSEVLAVLLWKQAFVFLDTPQAGLATAVAVIMSAVLVAGAYPYLRGLLREGER